MRLHVEPRVVAHKLHNTLLHIALAFFALDVVCACVPPLEKFIGDRGHMIVAFAALFEVSAGHLEAFTPPRRRHRVAPAQPGATTNV